MNTQLKRGAYAVAFWLAAPTLLSAAAFAGTNTNLPQRPPAPSLPDTKGTPVGALDDVRATGGGDPARAAVDHPDPQLAAPVTAAPLPSAGRCARAAMPIAGIVEAAAIVAPAQPTPTSPYRRRRC